VQSKEMLDQSPNLDETKCNEDLVEVEMVGADQHQENNDSQPDELDAEKDFEDPLDCIKIVGSADDSGSALSDSDASLEPVKAAAVQHGKFSAVGQTRLARVLLGQTPHRACT